jgi:hypothetical protein
LTIPQASLLTGKPRAIRDSRPYDIPPRDHLKNLTEVT